MVIRVQAMLCSTLLIVTFVEGRWHNFKTSREYRNEITTTASNEDLTDASIYLNNNGQQQKQQRQQFTELSRSVERFIRRRRHYPTASSESDLSDTDTTATLDKDYYNHAFKKRLDDSEDDEGEEFIEQRIPRYRFTFHRKVHDRAHLLRHLHRHHQQKQQQTRNIEDNPLLDLMVRSGGVDGGGGGGANGGGDVSGDDYEDYEEQQVRGKRHNRKRAWTEKDRKSFNNSRSRPLQFESNDKEIYEMEVREAQNSSLCNYTVIPIPDPGGRIPRELEHVKCNHVGSKCQDKGTYCCIQTYRNVQVLYENGREETLKIYSGCVCSLQIYGTLEPYTPDVDIDD